MVAVALGYLVRRSMADHPNKHIRTAVRSALDAGRLLVKSSARAHVRGILQCPHGGRNGCRRAVYSTSRSPEDHAKDLRRAIARCPH